MKQLYFFTLVLATTFFVAQMKPLLPHIGYYLNYDYITSELCIERKVADSNCHGNCFLEEKIQEQASSTEERTPSTALDTEQTHWLCYQTTQSHASPNNSSTYFTHDRTNKKVATLLIEVPTPPPLSL